MMNLKVEASRLAKVMIAYNAILLKEGKEAEAEDLRENKQEFEEVITELAQTKEKEELEEYLIHSNNIEGRFDRFIKTPTSIVHLAEKVLELETGDKLLDIGTGQGSFFIDSRVEADFTGIEKDEEVLRIAEIRKEYLDTNWNLVKDNAITYATEEKYDKVFVNATFGDRVILTDLELETLEDFTGIDKNALKRTSIEWIFNILAVKNIKETGKAVGIMKNGDLWNKVNKEVIKWFTDNGLIESVIALPDKLYTATSIAVTMLVFSKNNKVINMVDATSNWKELDRLRKEIKNIDEIISTIGKNRIENEIVAKEDYDIRVIKYLSNLPTEGEQLGNLCTSIYRGAQMKKDELEILLAEKETRFKFVKFSDFTDGYLNGEEESLKEIPEEYKKYCVKNNSILLSKHGNPTFKTAIVEKEEGEELLASGNIFVIEIDEEKVNPQYVQAFLTSTVGKLSIKSVSGGSVMKFVSISALKKMIIPMPSREVQDQIAKEYMLTLDEVKLYKMKYMNRMEKLNKVYEEMYNA